MKKSLFILTFFGVLFSCKNEPNTPTIVADPNINEHATMKIFSKLPFDFVCETRTDTTGVEEVVLKKVNLISADLKDPAFVIEITSCDEVSKEDYEKYNIPEETDSAVKGVTINKRDIIMIVRTEKPGIAIVNRGFEWSEGYKYEPYKKYTLNANGYKMESQTMITTNN